MRLSRLLLSFLFMILSCGKESNYVPVVGVNFTAALNDPRMSRLNVVGGAIAIEGYGVAGLIICRRADHVYVAFDRCSTVNPEKRCGVTIDDPGFIATDPCSGAKFSMFDGSAMKAPAVRPLKQYHVYTDNFTIRVTN